jgi:3-hydroxyacyl-CoA dehydrogenase
VDDQFVQQGMQKINSLFQALVDKRKISTTDKQKYMSKITAGTDYSRVAEAQIVIEAAVERLDVKQEIISKAQDINPLLIFASNTSRYLILYSCVFTFSVFQSHHLVDTHLIVNIFWVCISLILYIVCH